jgi:hypothetical protein
MSPLFLHRPLAAAIAAVVFASSGAAFAAPAAGPRDAAVPAVPAMPAMPDIQALVAEATEFAKRYAHESVLAALDVDLSGLPPSIAFIASEFGHPREIVKNAPYSAEAVTESIQLLPDGNRIVRKSTTLLARDGAGRTRQERKGDGRGGIFISDPMEGRNFVLNESSKTVTRIPRMPSMPMPPTPAAPPAPPTPPAGAMPPVSGSASGDVEVLPGKVVVRRKNSGGGDAGGAEDVHVEVIRIGRGEHAVAFPPSPPMPPVTLPMLPRGKGETKSLGTREFDGVKADGTMTTHTIPAGEIGNEKPILVTSERWFSPELHIVVFARTNDPRAGETIYRVGNVKRGEPPADLFRVPADYRTRGEGRKS